MSKKIKKGEEKKLEISVPQKATKPSINNEERRIISGIYKITHVPTGKFYIGQSQNIARRWREHCRKTNKNTKNSYIQNAMMAHGSEEFIIEIIKECPPEELNYWEEKYVAEMSPHYNLTKGGGGIRGYKFSQKSRKKQSDNTKKLWANRSEEEVQAVGKSISVAKKGAKLTEEHKKKIALAQTGKRGFRHSEKTKRDMAQMKAGKPLTPEHKLCIKLNNANSKRVKVNGLDFPCLRAASLYFGKSESYFSCAVCLKKQHPNRFKQWEIEFID